MKSILYLFLASIIIITGCSRKSVPPKPTHTISKNPVPSKPSNTNPTLATPTVPPKTPDSAVVTPAPAEEKPMVIVDAKGNFAVTANELPADASKDILNISSARSYTPAEIKNLAYRFKYIPPRILYVPEGLVKTSNRGSYYVYNKKFWYWKKDDGYFYLDENYYK